jgi:hypothetical protein
MALYPLSLWIYFFQYSGNDWDLLILKSAQKKELPNSVTRFGLLPIEIPHINMYSNIYISFCQEKFLTCHLRFKSAHLISSRLAMARHEP